MTKVNTQNLAKIDSYIEENPTCKQPKTEPIKLRGERHDIQIYRLPLKLTFYNIKNGRFASEYADLKEKIGRELDATNTDDSKKIQLLLLNQDIKHSDLLQKDISKNRQTSPGIITNDGYLINGNRRRAILERLVESGEMDFDFIEVARLPPNVDAQDLWRVEAGIQLSRSMQLDYGPINELLKFKEGIDSGLKPEQIANELFGGTIKEIEDKLKDFKLIAEYLDYVREPERFSIVKGKYEQFVELRKRLEEFDKSDPRNEEKVKVKRIVFQLIFEGITHRNIRIVKEILANKSIRNEFYQAEKYSKPEPISIKMKNIAKAKESGGPPTYAIYENCTESVKALSRSDNPIKSLKVALKNLENIDIKYYNRNDSETRSLMEDIKEAIHRIESSDNK